MEVFLAFLLLVFGVIVFMYFLPSILAPESRKFEVLIVNFFFGWTIIGWIIALMMAIWATLLPILNSGRHTPDAPVEFLEWCRSRPATKEKARAGVGARASRYRNSVGVPLRLSSFRS